MDLQDAPFIPPKAAELPDAPFAGPQPAHGVSEAIQAGYQGSVRGLELRGKLPDLIVDPHNSAWWERALASTTQVVSELPEMTAGTVGGAAGGTLVGGPVGGILGGGAGMMGVPAAIRQSLIEAYKDGGIKTTGEFFTALQNVAKETLTQGALGAATMGAGSIGARVVGQTVTPLVGETISPLAARTAITAADTTAQIATMTVVPPLAQGQLPNLQDITDAAIVVGGMHAAGTAAAKIGSLYAKTGRLPAQVVADSKVDPSIAADLATPMGTTIVPAESTVQSRVFDELKQAGRDDAEATHGAKLWESFFNTMADRTGKTPDELFDRYYGGIRSEAPPASADAAVPPPRGGEGEAPGAASDRLSQPGSTTDLIGNIDRRIAQADRTGMDERRRVEAELSGKEAPPSFRMTDTGPELHSKDIRIADSDYRENDYGGAQVHDSFIYDGSGNQIGSTNLGWRGDQVTDISMVYLDPKAQKTGAGEKFIRTLLAHNQPDTVITVHDILESARGFWEKMGVKFEGGKNGEGNTGLLESPGVAAREAGAAQPDARTGETVFRGPAGETRGTENAATGSPGEAAGAGAGIAGDGTLTRADYEAARKAKLYQAVRLPYHDDYGFLPDGSFDYKLPDESALAALRRAAAGIEKPHKGVTLRITDNGEAIATGPKGTSVPEAFVRFAQDNGLKFMAQRKLDRDIHPIEQGGSTGDHYGKAMPADYRAAGALYFNEMGKVFLDRTGKTLFQFPTFYSDLNRQVDSLATKSAPAKGWKDQIKGLVANGKVKQAEIDAVGLNDWLDLQQGKVSKEQVQEFLKNNGVQVQEVTLTGEQKRGLEGEDARRFDELMQRTDLTPSEEREMDALVAKSDAAIAARGKSNEPQVKFASYQLPGGENYKELVGTIPGYEYESPHFPGIKGYIFHTRFNERIDADGKRVLFIEELQADGAQKGRKEGFKGTTEEDAKRFFDISDEIWANISAEDRAAHRQDMLDYRGRDKRVPSAPFVGKTEAWTALALKRMIRYAAENGFDKIAWTNGEQQAARYDLSKQVDSVSWTDWPAAGKDHGVLEAHKDGNSVIKETIPASKIEDYVGKEVARKLLEQKDDVGGRKTLEGQDLKVGGEGMKGYYDKIVPGVAKDVLKKLGGGKVGEVRVATGSPEAAETRVVRDDDGTHAIEERRTDEDGNSFWEPVAFGLTKEAADARNIAGGHVPHMSQPGFDITPALKEKVMAGQPLFQRQEGDNENRGYLEFGNKGRMTIGLLAAADKSTFLHESGHFFLEVLNDLGKGKDAPVQIKADLQTLYDWFGVKDADAWNAMSLEQKRQGHEMFAQGFEKYLMTGDAPSVGLREIFDQFRQWLVALYRNASTLNVNVSPEVQSVMARMLAADNEIKEGTPRAYAQGAAAARMAQLVNVGKAKEVADKPRADAIPQLPGEPSLSTHVNYNLATGSDDIKLIQARLSEVYEGYIQSQRQGTIKWDEQTAAVTQHLTDLMGGEADTYHILSPREPGTPAGWLEIRVRAEMADQAAAALDKVIDEYDVSTATPEQTLQFYAAIERSAMIQAEFLGARSEPGRAMNALKDTSRTANRAALVKEVIDRYGGAPPEVLVAKLKEIDTQVGRMKFAKEAADATTYEKVIEAWKAGMLSGVITQMRNIIGNTSGLIVRPMVDAAAVPFGLLRGSEADRVRAVEPMARVIGQFQGMADGLKLAVASFKTEAWDGKSELFAPAIRGKTGGTSTWDKVQNKAGPIIRTPFRALSAADIFFRTSYERGEAYALAGREASKEGINPATHEFIDSMLKHVQNPTDEMKAGIEEAGLRQTFNTPWEPGGPGASFQNFVRKAHLEFLFPFNRTPTRVLQETIRLTPFAPAIKAWREDFKAGGARADRAMAELSVGAGFMSLTFMAAINGFVTGAGDPDPGKRAIAVAAGVQPYSFHIKGKYYNYQGLGPLGTVIGMGADSAIVWDHMADDERDKIAKIIAIAFANAVTSQSALMGMTNLVQVTGDPTRYGPSFFNNFAGSFVPAISANIAQMTDDTARRVDSMLGQIKSRIPGLRETLLPKRDAFGTPIATKDRLLGITPVTETTDSTDKVRLEAARLGISAPSAPKKVHLGRGSGKIGDIALTPEQQDAYSQAAGEIVHAMMEPLVNSVAWEHLPDMVQKRAYQKAFELGNKAGAMKALPPDIREGVINEITQKVTKEMALTK